MSTADPTSMEQHEGMSLAALLRLVWRHKLLIAGLSLLGGVVAAVLALVATEIYRAEVVVTEAQQDAFGGAASLMNQIGGLASLAGMKLGEGGAGREAKALLRSRRLAEEFISRNDLLPVLFPNPDSLRKATLWFGVYRFKASMLNVREDTRTDLITISINARNPRDAARWANGYVALANDLMRARAIEEASRNIAYLDEQIAKTSVVELRRVMYKLVENETKTLMLANARADYAFSVVDPAVAPELRTSPQRTLMVMIGLVLGWFVGIAAAVGRNAYLRGRKQAASQ